MKILFIAAITFVMLGLIAVAGQMQSGNALFAQAQAKENGGNMAEAIRIYESIVTQYATDHALAAKALLQIGLCHLRQGNAEEARKAFARILRDYSDQKEPFAEANARLAAPRVPGLRGAIRGRVTERGQISDAQVFALKAVYNDGQRVLTSLLSARTNSRGEYDLSPLRPGKYLVAARLVAIDTAGRVSKGPYGPIFFPDTPDQRQAMAVEVRPGVNISNLEIHMGPVPLRRVRGTVTGMEPSAGLNVTLTMENELPPALLNLPVTARVFANGSFEFPGVPPGSYVLWASQDYGKAGHVAIEVRDRDLEGVDIAMVPGLAVSVRIVWEPRTAPAPYPESRSVSRVTLRRDPPLRGSTFYYSYAESGRFKFFGAGDSRPPQTGVNSPRGMDPKPLQKGNYRVSVEPILAPPITPEGLVPVIPLTSDQQSGILAGTYVKSIRLGNADVLNDGLRLSEQPVQELVIVIGSNPGTLEGRVVNARKEPVPLSTVVLIPEGGIRFHVDHRFTTTDASGRFLLQRIPPGDYKVFAWQDVEDGAWQDPDFVRPYESKGKSIQIKEGARQINVEVIAN